MVKTVLSCIAEHTRWQMAYTYLLFSVVLPRQALAAYMGIQSLISRLIFISYVTWFYWLYIYIYIYIIRLITYNHIMSELFHFYHEKCRGIRMIQLPIGLKDLQNCMLCAGIVYRIRVNCIRTIELRIIKHMKTIVKFEVVWPAVSTFLSRELQHSCFFYFH